ncbi:MAG: DUF4838 domain-containing protein [Clostridia bacterium]|nr:DUF4838 domain-containing protein [Clostridia bacterium]
MGNNEACCSAPRVGRIEFSGKDISSFRIVVSKDAAEVVKEAAGELQKYLKLSAGYELPIVTDAEAAGGGEILVGRTNRDNEAVLKRMEGLQNDGFIHYAEGDRIYLVSLTDLGNHYAVYRFLETCIGWRFLSNRYEFVRKADVVKIPADLDYADSPGLFYRQTDWGFNRDTRLKVGQNSGLANAYNIVGFCHTMQALTGVPQSEQPCLSDENVYQTVLKNVRAWIDKNPGCRIVSVTQNDNDRYCKCPKCEALAAKENQSGVLLNFVNQLADEIKKDHPEVYILTFAYWYTRKAPVTIKPRENVIIWMCSIECCFSHPLNDPSCELNRDFCADLEEWKKKTDRILFWDYTTNYVYFVQPFPNFGVLRKNVNYLAKSGAIGIYEEGNYQTETSGEFSELRGYVLSKLLWDPYMSEEKYQQLIKDYLADYFGAGWPYIYEYIQKTSEKAKKIHLTIFRRMKDEDPSSWLFQADGGGLDVDFVKQMSALWDKAYEAAQDEIHKEHVDCCRGQADYMSMVAAWYEKRKTDKKFAKKYLERLKKHGCTRVRENGDEGPIDYMLNSGNLDLPPHQWW